MIKAILFDLDGTLLPMDQDTFVKAYFKGLAAAVSPCGYEPETLIKNFWLGVAAMSRNDGSATNEQVFWNTFIRLYGEKALEDKPYFEGYYENEFAGVKNACGFNPGVKSFIDNLKTKGHKIVLATNPLFPKAATKARIEWAGLSPEDFEFYTTYENYRYCKPNLDYYREILNLLNLTGEECVMIGNDVAEDMVAEQLGMKVFLLTDCLINKNNEDISKYPNGNLKDLADYLDSILD